jgi:hypothetical protein
VAAHLPPVIAGQESVETAYSTKWPLRTHAEGGQVELMLGRLVLRVKLISGASFI